MMTKYELEIMLKKASGGNVLRVWFSCSLFMSGEHGVKITAPLQAYTRQMAQCVLWFLKE
jgi:hypothetical protein